MTNLESPVNRYIDTYIHNYIRSFRNFITYKFRINIEGLADFITADDHDVSLLLHKLQTYGFNVTITNGQNTIDEIQVYYICDENEKENFEYRIENLISTIYLSSRTGISIVGILVMQIISKIICRYKTMYKALILDLDDTLWKGTLAEDGFKTIKRNLCSNDGIPFVTFMRFIQAVTKELGLYIAICTRNSIDLVQSAIDKFNEKEFPLKSHIDCIVANNNDKSENIKAIAQKLSVLTNACVFIDDNQLIRNEVRKNLPEVFVPDWENHYELITLLTSCCVFDRFELSLKSRNRKQLYEIIKIEREKNYRPKLFVKVSVDKNHVEAVRLYAKSNQFNFNRKKNLYDECKSLVFEIYRDNGENLGICSTVTYAENEQEIHITNWAISCRYFEIGLEEFILIYLYTLSGGRLIRFSFINTGVNKKVVELIAKYNKAFIKNDVDENIYFSPNTHTINQIQLNTNLIGY